MQVCFWKCYRSTRFLNMKAKLQHMHFFNALRERGITKCSLHCARRDLDPVNMEWSTRLRVEDISVPRSSCVSALVSADLVSKAPRTSVQTINSITLWSRRSVAAVFPVHSQAWERRLSPPQENHLNISVLSLTKWWPPPASKCVCQVGCDVDYAQVLMGSQCSFLHSLLMHQLGLLARVGGRASLSHEPWGTFTRAFEFFAF